MLPFVRRLWKLRAEMINGGVIMAFRKPDEIAELAVESG